MSKGNQSPPSDVGTATCARCNQARNVRHMVRLNSGRWLCRGCVAVLRGRVGREAVDAQIGGASPEHSPEPEKAPSPSMVGVEGASDPDWGIDPVPEPTDPYDAAEVDSVPCPKCGTTVVFGVPTCEQCGIILEDYWEEEEVRHPTDRAVWQHRYVVRAAILTVILLLLYLARPKGDEPLRWEGILDEVFANGGQSLDERQLGAAIHPSIERVRRNLIVQNDDTFDWVDVELRLNARAGGLDPYVLNVSRIREGQRKQYPLVNFAKDDGTQFTPIGVPISRVDIHAETPDGKAVWSSPKFVDATKDATVD